MLRGNRCIGISLSTQHCYTRSVSRHTLQIGLEEGLTAVNPNLQVGLKMQFQGAQGQLMFFFGNKGEATLERLICAVPPSGQFTFQQGPVPPQLEAKKQIQVASLLFPRFAHLMMTCSSPASSL